MQTFFPSTVIRSPSIIKLSSSTRVCSTSSNESTILMPGRNYDNHVNTIIKINTYWDDVPDRTSGGHSNTDSSMLVTFSAVYATYTIFSVSLHIQNIMLKHDVIICTSILISNSPLEAEFAISSTTPPINCIFSSVCSLLSAMLERSANILPTLSDMRTVAKVGSRITLVTGLDIDKMTLNCSVPSEGFSSASSTTGTHCSALCC